MSLAPVAYMLYQRVMRHDPADTHLIGRDRFVLSLGHSSLTQYVQLVTDAVCAVGSRRFRFRSRALDLEALRTWGSLTPGHPEYGHAKGVEITTGPPGQGLALLWASHRISIEGDTNVSFTEDVTARYRS